MSPKSLMSVERQYDHFKVWTIASNWRKPHDRSLGAAFCKFHGTASCPHGGECPNKGHCGSFLINASDFEAAKGLFSKDAKAHNFELNVA